MNMVSVHVCVMDTVYVINFHRFFANYCLSIHIRSIEDCYNLCGTPVCSTYSTEACDLLGICYMYTILSLAVLLYVLWCVFGVDTILLQVKKGQYYDYSQLHKNIILCHESACPPPPPTPTPTHFETHIYSYPLSPSIKGYILLPPF